MTTRDTKYTDDLICPHCFESQSEVWELNIGEDGKDVFCGACCKEFHAVASISITYTTSKE